jgi:hypothetical protein
MGKRWAPEMPEQHRRRPHRPAPPALLDPILQRWEQLDRRRRRIRPIRARGVVGIEFARHGGDPLTLADGTRVRWGDPIGILHLDNRRGRELAQPGWQSGGMPAARLDLATLAAWATRQPAGQRPVAYTGTTLLAPLARRLGFELRPHPRTARARLDDWFMRWLMAHWSPAGRARLQRGHTPLRSSDIWLSDRALQQRFTPPQPGVTAVDADSPGT